MNNDPVKGLETTVLHTGWAQKRGAGMLAGWANRFFVLDSDGKLSYFEDEKQHKKKGTIYLIDASHVSKSDDKTFIIHTPERKWTIWCLDRRDASKWNQILSNEIKRIHEQTKKQTNNKPNPTNTNSNTSTNTNTNTNSNSNANSPAKANSVPLPNSGPSAGYAALGQIQQQTYPTPFDASNPHYGSPPSMEYPRMMASEPTTNMFAYNEPRNPYYSTPTPMNNSINNNQNNSNVSNQNNPKRHSFPNVKNSQQQQQQQQQLSQPQRYDLSRHSKVSNMSGFDEKSQEMSNNNSVLSNASAPMMMESKDNNERFIENSNIKFIIPKSAVSLKNLKLNAFMSYFIENGNNMANVGNVNSMAELISVGAVNAPNERFFIKCIDEQKNLYSIQTCQGTYLSATPNGSITFQNQVYGVFEQWRVRYYHINQISFQSYQYGGYLGSDANGSYHCRYKMVTQITVFECSPPVTIDDASQKHLSEMVASMHLTNSNIMWPMLPPKICLQNQATGTWLGVEKSHLKTNFRDYCAIDGSPLPLNLFEVIQKGLLPLFAFRSFSGSYLSPLKSGKIGFTNELTDNEYFQIIWHSNNIISLKLWNNRCIYVNNKDNSLYCNQNNWKSPECAFLVKPSPKIFTSLSAPLPLPQLNKKIYLKSKMNDKFLTYRSKPDHFEATSLIMAQWESLVINVKKLDNSGLIVNIITANGKYFKCENDATIKFVIKDEGPQCWWEIFFHNRKDICIRSYQLRNWWNLNSKGWLFCDQRHPLQAITKENSIFECVPWASVGGNSNQNRNNSGFNSNVNNSNNSVAFTM